MKKDWTLDAAMEHLIALMVQHDKNEIERFGLRDQALVLQAAEYERRLKDLNHEAMRIGQVLAESVTREKYDDGIAAEAKAREEALARRDEQLELMQLSITAHETFLAKLKIVGALTAPMLLLAGGVISRLLGG